MSGSLRYQNPIVRDHIASHYVLGTMTPLVRRRTERLLLDDDDLQKAIALWQKRLSPMNQIANPITPPLSIKKNIMATISGSVRDSSKTAIQQVRKSMFQTLWLWRSASASLFIAFLFAVFLALPVSNLPSISYLAAMNNSQIGSEAPLVITGYGKTEQDSSKLVFRWNERIQKVSLANTSIWTIDRDSGEMFNLGKLSEEINQKTLTKEQWAAVKSSLELVIIAGDSKEGKVILRGLCLQLMPWST